MLCVQLFSTSSILCVFWSLIFSQTVVGFRTRWFQHASFLSPHMWYIIIVVILHSNVLITFLVAFLEILFHYPFISCWTIFIWSHFFMFVRHAWEKVRLKNKCSIFLSFISVNWWLGILLLFHTPLKNGYLSLCPLLHMSDHMSS